MVPIFLIDKQLLKQYFVMGVNKKETRMALIL
jgi:hypothetical protein